jgi:hypothetical protein
MSRTICRGESRSNGGGPDAFTVSVVHPKGTGAGRRIIQDVMRDFAKPCGADVNLEGIVAEIAALATAYRAREVHGDRYAKGWVLSRPVRSVSVPHP